MSHNAKVYIAARSKEKAEQAILDLKEQTGKEAIFLELDLSDLRSVKAAAEQFQRCELCSINQHAFSSTNSQEKNLHVLFNNAYPSMLRFVC